MIKRGTVVNLAYKLTNKAGETLDQANLKDPFVYLHGTGQIIPGLETAMEGLKPGDKTKITVAPKEGYGEVDPNLKLVVSRAQFPATAELEQGMRFQAESGGEEVLFTVEKIEGDQVHIDGNHPMAGETLHFDVEVLSVRPATEEEIEHGHAHGEHGHDHGHSHDDDDEELEEDDESESSH